MSFPVRSTFFSLGDWCGSLGWVAKRSLVASAGTDIPYLNSVMSTTVGDFYRLPNDFIQFGDIREAEGQVAVEFDVILDRLQNHPWRPLESTWVNYRRIDPIGSVAPVDITFLVFSPANSTALTEDDMEWANAFDDANRAPTFSSGVVTVDLELHTLLSSSGLGIYFATSLPDDGEGTLSSYIMYVDRITGEVMAMIEPYFNRGIIPETVTRFLNQVNSR